MDSTKASPIQGLATELFRREHLQIKQSLAQVGDLVGHLHAYPQISARKTMDEVVQLLKKAIGPHADWEDRVLYPIIDRCAVSGPHPFTSTMRHEHKIIARQLDDLALEVLRSSPDAKRFARHADNLLGLIAAHFENEEEVLLVILDASMTAEEFRRAIVNQEEHGVGPAVACQTQCHGG